jgi:hypothetical protein
VIAIINAHYDLPIYLLEHGADPNIADKFGRTALYAAVDMHTLEKSATRPDPKETDKATSLDVVKAALAHGANPNAALKESAGRGSLDVPDRYLAEGRHAFHARGEDRRRGGDAALAWTKAPTRKLSPRITLRP